MKEEGTFGVETGESKTEIEQNQNRFELCCCCTFHEYTARINLAIELYKYTNVKWRMKSF